MEVLQGCTLLQWPVFIRYGCVISSAPISVVLVSNIQCFWTCCNIMYCMACFMLYYFVQITVNTTIVSIWRNKCKLIKLTITIFPQIVVNKRTLCSSKWALICLSSFNCEWDLPQSELVALKHDEGGGLWINEGLSQTGTVLTCEISYIQSFCTNLPRPPWMNQVIHCHPISSLSILPGRQFPWFWSFIWPQLVEPATSNIVLLDC